ncbi:acetyl-coenzyme A synthetase, partial [Streptomyces sp. Ru71]|uniref:acetyl-coenzyme A synthetase N-terminal domain-containing protein n=1 Tax=Streptomyces sp. Ru71 TaxID=2080746 RepID=UPI000D4CCF41
MSARSDDRVRPQIPSTVPVPSDGAAADRLAYWAEQAGRLHWDTEWHQVLDWSDAPYARWFTGGRLNVAYNCVDRHVEAGYGDQVAFHWEGEPGDTRTITYA